MSNIKNLFTLNQEERDAWIRDVLIPAAKKSREAYEKLPLEKKEQINQINAEAEKRLEEENEYHRKLGVWFDGR